MHGHHMRDFKDCRTVIIWRDPRDIIVSWYYYSLFPTEWTHPKYIEQNRKAVPFTDIDDIKRNLPSFIDYVYVQQRSPHFTWSEFFDRWFDREDMISTSYEVLRAQPVQELMRVAGVMGVELEEPEAREIVERYSFEKLTGRRAGEEAKRTFLRKGVAGDWKNHFTRRAGEVMAQHVGDRLVRSGYERDDTWVNKLPPS